MAGYSNNDSRSSDSMADYGAPVEQEDPFIRMRSALDNPVSADNQLDQFLAKDDAAYPDAPVPPMGSPQAPQGSPFFPSGGQGPAQPRPTNMPEGAPNSQLQGDVGMHEMPDVTPPSLRDDPLVGKMQSFAQGGGQPTQDAGPAFQAGMQGAAGGVAGSMSGAPASGGAGAGKPTDYLAKAREALGYKPESSAHSELAMEGQGLALDKAENARLGHAAEAEAHAQAAADIARDNKIEANRMKMEADAADDAEQAIARERAHADAMRTNPNRYKENLGFGGTALAALTMLVGGLGAGVSGQKNLAMEAFDDAVNKDIAVQKEAYDRGIHKVKGMEDDYSRRRQRLGDERATRHMLLSDKYRGAAELLQSKLSTIAANGSTIDGQAAVNMLQMKAVEQEEAAKKAVAEKAFALRAADQAKAAAAAHAEAARQRAFAEKIAFERLQQQNKLELAAMKAAGKGGKGGIGGASTGPDGLERRTQKYGEKADKQVDVLRNVAELRQMMNDDGEVVGITPTLRGGVNRAVGNVMHATTLGTVPRGRFQQDDYNTAQRRWGEMKLAAQHAITGASSSDEERAELTRQFELASADPAALKSFVDDLEGRAKARMFAAGKQYGPDAANNYELRGKGQGATGGSGPEDEDFKKSSEKDEDD